MHKGLLYKNTISRFSWYRPYTTIVERRSTILMSFILLIKSSLLHYYLIFCVLKMKIEDKARTIPMLPDRHHLDRAWRH